MKFLPGFLWLAIACTLFGRTGDFIASRRGAGLVLLSFDDAALLGLVLFGAGIIYGAASCRLLTLARKAKREAESAEK